MYAIVDARAPKNALRSLEREFSVIPFLTQGITYDEVAGHPDIFIFQQHNKFVVANNIPEDLFDVLAQSNSTVVRSKHSVGSSLADSTLFNCCSTDSYFFHKKGASASEIAALTDNKTAVYLPQGYARCSMIALSDRCIITSDMGIKKALQVHEIDALWVDPSQICLPGFRSGFVGGTCGLTHNTVYFLGNILEHSWGKAVELFLNQNGYAVNCLCNGTLYDGGGVFFVE